MEILFEDNHLLVVNKPADCLTQPTQHQTDSIETQAKERIKRQAQKRGNVFLHAVHRLDRPVSGVVVFAKTAKALSRLNASIRDRKTKKTYLALVEGVPEIQVGENDRILEHYLAHDAFRARIDPSGKKATLKFCLLKQTAKGSLVEIELITGRYHQIRIQFASIGCPILGDHKYGSTTSFNKQAIALHHYKLAIEHPTLKTMLHFQAPIPSHWTELFEPPHGLTQVQKRPC